jgi:spoIIIJ-associated protein
VIATGKTVEEATENGCRELGLARDEVSVEILEMPAKKLFKSTPAKVMVRADADEKEEAAQQQAKKAEKPPEPKREAAPAAEKPEKKEAAPAKPKEKPAAQAAKKPADEPEVPIEIDSEPQVKAAAEYLGSIFQAMGAGEVEMTALRQGDATLLRVEGANIADKIEIRGETIQALSYLIDRAVNTGVDKKDAGYLRIRLDIAGYRNRREGELVALANRVGSEVARTARSKTLPPMNPYERLIIHTAISSIDGITSESIGSDVERRVVVKSLADNATDGGDWRPAKKGQGRGGRGGSGGGGRRDGRDNNNRRDSRGGGRGRGPGSGGGGPRSYGDGPRPSSTPEREYADKPRDPDATPVVPGRRESIRDGEDLPLYGKIEL